MRESWLWGGDARARYQAFHRLCTRAPIEVLCLLDASNSISYWHALPMQLMQLMQPAIIATQPATQPTNQPNKLHRFHRLPACLSLPTE